jgi:hypothetical protein
MHVQRDDVHLERGVLRFAGPDQLWIEVRIVGILLRATLLHLVEGCEARWWIVGMARIITITACAVTAAITASYVACRSWLSLPSPATMRPQDRSAAGSHRSLGHPSRGSIPLVPSGASTCALSNKR